MILHHDEMHTSSSKEAEPPPPPPGLQGTVTLRMGDTNGTTQQVSISTATATDFWPTGSSGRQVILVPLSDSDEFLAFGIIPATNSLTYCCRVPFVAWGKVSTDLEVFLKRMAESGAEVGLYSQAPLEVLQQYISSYPEVFSLRTGQTLLSALGWKQGSSNEDNDAVSAA